MIFFSSKIFGGNSDSDQDQCHAVRMTSHQSVGPTRTKLGCNAVCCVVLHVKRLQEKKIKMI